MKKVILPLIVLVLIIPLIVVGCSNTPSSPAQPSQPSKTETGSSQDQTIDLKFAFHIPPQAYFAKAAIEWAQTIMDASNGKVKITTYPGGTLVKQQDEYDAVLSNLCDIILLYPDITPGRFQLSGLDTLPMLFPSAEVCGSVYWDIIEKYYLDTDFSKVKILWDQAMPPQQTISNKPIEKMSDFQGTKWLVQSKIESWTMAALGSSPSLIDLGEAYTSLDKGVVDGINFTWEGTLAFGFQEITKYRTESNLVCRSSVVAMNMDKWNSLPQDIKDIFTQYGGKEYSTMAGVGGDKAMEGTKQAILGYDQKVGNPPIIELSDDERAKWIDACQTVWERWAKEKDDAGLPGSAILQDAQDLVKNYDK